MDPVTVTPALRELFAHKTQTAIATELTARGLKVDQTKVSAWMNGRQPSIEQLAAIEDWAGVPRGWVLARAGYLSMPGVEPISSPDDAAQLRALVAALSDRVEHLQRTVDGLLDAADERASSPSQPGAAPSQRGSA